MNTTATKDLSVATEILNQLGGRRFTAMTGAKHFMGDERFLSFRLPSNFAAKGINHVKITLTPFDTYTVEFNSIRGINFRNVSKFESVYCDYAEVTSNYDCGKRAQNVLEQLEKQ